MCGLHYQQIFNMLPLQKGINVCSTLSTNIRHASSTHRYHCVFYSINKYSTCFLYRKVSLCVLNYQQIFNMLPLQKCITECSTLSKKYSTCFLYRQVSLCVLHCQQIFKMRPLETGITECSTLSINIHPAFSVCSTLTANIQHASSRDRYHSVFYTVNKYSTFFLYKQVSLCVLHCQQIFNMLPLQTGINMCSTHSTNIQHAFPTDRYRQIG